MIISHKHKYIYIRPMKTASSSIEKYLINSVYNRNSDIHNRVSPKVAGPHLNASQICSHMDKNKWDEYTKMVSERNPFDKVVSLYYWEVKRQDPKIPINLKQIQNNKQVAFKEFDKWFKMRIEPLQYEDTTQKNALSHRYYFIGDEYVPVFFVRYENLVEDFNEFCKLINHNFDIKKFNTNKEKVGVRPNWAKDYKPFFKDEHIEKISDLCREQIQLLDYKF
jgi:hypothetical protein